jgi:predicted dehydrogenase
MASRRLGLVGCGFFARNHLEAWRQLGVQLVGVCDRDGARAEACAQEFGGHPYTDLAEMLARERPDFVDIVTPPSAHRILVEQAAAQGVHVICQKPLAPGLEDARAMVRACREAGVRFMVHENFRWQRPMRELKRRAEGLGRLFFGRISFRSAHDVYRDQPYLAQDPRFILLDLGVHLLDLARFFFGEFAGLSCQTARVNPHIRGEDVATVLLRGREGAACVVELSYASRLEEELFPQTLVHLEGERGSLTLGPGYRLNAVQSPAEGFRSGREGLRVEHAGCPPAPLPWSTPPFEAIQESVLRIQEHWLECLEGGHEPETSGEDNLQTLELVFACYRSAERGEEVRL